MLASWRSASFSAISNYFRKTRLVLNRSINGAPGPAFCLIASMEVAGSRKNDGQQNEIQRTQQ
jgi:hypothetical protein